LLRQAAGGASLPGLIDRRVSPKLPDDLLDYLLVESAGAPLEAVSAWGTALPFSSAGAVGN
jgi:hypothetical protein